MTTSDGLTQQEEQQVIDILKKWNGGPLSSKLFTFLAGMLPQPTIETVILRKNNGNTEVLLTKRPENDPNWPGLLHSPGGVLRRMDYDREDKIPLNGVFERIQNDEINAKFLYTPKFVNIAQYMTKRGPEAVHIFFTEIDPNSSIPQGAEWHGVDELEHLDNFMKHQIKPITIAANAFEKHSTI